MDSNLQRTITKDILSIAVTQYIIIILCIGQYEFMLGRISIVIDKYKAHSIPIALDANQNRHLTNNPKLKDMLSSNSKALGLSMAFL